MWKIQYDIRTVIRNKMLNNRIVCHYSIMIHTNSKHRRIRLMFTSGSINKNCHAEIFSASISYSIRKNMQK